MKFKEWFYLLEMPMRTETDLPQGVYVRIRSFLTSTIIKFADVKGRRFYVDKDGTITIQETGQWLGEM